MTTESRWKGYSFNPSHNSCTCNHTKYKKPSIFVTAVADVHPSLPLPSHLPPHFLVLPFPSPTSLLPSPSPHVHTSKAPTICRAHTSRNKMTDCLPSITLGYDTHFKGKALQNGVYFSASCLPCVVCPLPYLQHLLIIVFLCTSCMCSEYEA